MTIAASYLTRTSIATLAALLLTACSGGSSSSQSTPPPPPPPPPPPVTNNAPVISGSPDTFVIRDQTYDFTPTASDPDLDTLTFSITNPPGWASFDEMTGNLAGTPDANDIGTTSSVTISVFDSMAQATLAPFDLEVRQVPLGSATVSWSAPTTNSDGTTLLDLAGFRVHYGTVSQNYDLSAEVRDETAQSLLIPNLEAGTYFFAVAAFDHDDNESVLSSEVSKLVAP
jgi:hypothetical protein